MRRDRGLHGGDQVVAGMRLTVPSGGERDRVDHLLAAPIRQNAGMGADVAQDVLQRIGDAFAEGDVADDDLAVART
jgi:hypothetical protein